MDTTTNETTAPDAQQTPDVTTEQTAALPQLSQQTVIALVVIGVLLQLSIFGFAVYGFVKFLNRK